MVLTFGSPSFLPVLVATVVTFLLGWLWYSKALFGNAWMKASGNKETTSNKKNGVAVSMIVGIVTQFVMMWVLAMIIFAVGSTGWIGGVTMAFWVWLGFVATIGVGMAIWDHKPMALFWINTIHWLVVLAVAGAIIGAWM